MPHILALPPELLTRCALGLVAKDIKALTLVCHQFQAVFKYKLYENIARGYDATEDEYHQTGATMVRKAQVLIQNLQNDEKLTRGIRKLSIGCEFCWHEICYCCFLSKALILDVSNTITTTKLTRLQHLKLNLRCMESEYKLPIMPELKTLWVSDYWEKEISPQHLLKVLSQPRLQYLILENIVMAPILLESDRTPPNSNLVKLVLWRVELDENHLEAILRPLRGLKALYIDGISTPAKLKWDNHLLSSLAGKEDLIEELSVVPDYDCGDVERDFVWISSLLGFIRLRRLVVDPAFLLGFAGCSSRAKTSEFSDSTGEFGSMLPTSLEELEIVFDTMQVLRIKNYRKNILFSVVNERYRLSNLRYVAFDDILPIKTMACSGRSCCKKGDTMMSTKKLFESHELQKKCSELGVNIKFRTSSDRKNATSFLVRSLMEIDDGIL